jgi:hypothetical protein
LVCLVLGACSADPTDDTSPQATLVELRVYSSPYDDVDWSNDVRLTAQHHDHVAASTSGILAYDAAGYDVLSLMDYSGDSKMKESLRQRLWPVNQVVPSSLLPSLKSIKFFLPNAEESGLPLRSDDNQLKHVTSPFLETYIEGAGSYGQALVANQYGTVEQLFARIRQFGGIPCVAHAWNWRYENTNLGQSYCVEVYSAFAEALKELNVPYYTSADRNRILLQNWDRALMANQRIYAIAVNDHFGPQNRSPISAQITDSGKILVLAKAVTLPAYREAFAAGRFFAVRDLGVTKNLYPRIFSIDSQEDRTYIETLGSVRWIANGEVIGEGPMLLHRNLLFGTTYIRAEVVGEDGSTVYTQAFSVRPKGDANGDHRIDSADRALCIDVLGGGVATDAERRACAVPSAVPTTAPGGRP